MSDALDSTRWCTIWIARQIQDRLGASRPGWWPTEVCSARPSCIPARAVNPIPRRRLVKMSLLVLVFLGSS